MKMKFFHVYESMELLKVITTGTMEIYFSDYTYGKFKETPSKKYSEAVDRAGVEVLRGLSQRPTW